MRISMLAKLPIFINPRKLIHAKIFKFTVVPNFPCADILVTLHSAPTCGVSSCATCRAGWCWTCRRGVARPARTSYSGPRSGAGASTGPTGAVRTSCSWRTRRRAPSGPTSAGSASRPQVRLIAGTSGPYKV